MRKILTAVFVCLTCLGDVHSTIRYLTTDDFLQPSQSIQETRILLEDGTRAAGDAICFNNFVKCKGNWSINLRDFWTTGQSHLGSAPVLSALAAINYVNRDFSSGTCESLYCCCMSSCCNANEEAEQELFSTKGRDVARVINLYGSLRRYFTYFNASGVYDGTDHASDGVLSKYAAFARAFGLAMLGGESAASYWVSALTSPDYPRSANNLLLWIGVEESTGGHMILECNGSRKLNACLQLLLLSEIVETKKCNGEALEDEENFIDGYTPGIPEKIAFLLNVLNGIS